MQCKVLQYTGVICTNAWKVSGSEHTVRSISIWTAVLHFKTFGVKLEMFFFVFVVFFLPPLSFAWLFSGVGKSSKHQKVCSFFRKTKTKPQRQNRQVSVPFSTANSPPYFGDDTDKICPPDIRLLAFSG